MTRPVLQGLCSCNSGRIGVVELCPYGVHTRYGKPTWHSSRVLVDALGFRSLTPTAIEVEPRGSTQESHGQGPSSANNHIAFAQDLRIASCCRLDQWRRRTLLLGSTEQHVHWSRVEQQACGRGARHRADPARLSTDVGRSPVPNDSSRLSTSGTDNTGGTCSSRAPGINAASGRRIR